MTNDIDESVEKVGAVAAESGTAGKIKNGTAISAGAETTKAAENGKVAEAGQTSAEPRTYTIREVARQFHMEPSALRYYEDQGLLTNVRRNASGQREYEECHINRLRAICCFKNAGMTIGDLKKFFLYESNEPEHIDEILELLESRREALDEQRRALNEAALHVQRKLHFYGDIKRSLDEHRPLPDWKYYKTRKYSIDC